MGASLLLSTATCNYAMIEPMNTRYIVSGIVQKGDLIALGKKAQGRPPYPDAWHLPGGGVEDAALAASLFRRGDYDNDYFHQEVRREIREELGIEVKSVRCLVPQFLDEPLEDKTPNKQGEMTHYYFLGYLCDYASGELAAADDLEVAHWVKKSELSSYSLTPPSQVVFRELGWLTYKNPDGSITSPLDHLPLWPLMSTVAWQVAGPILVLGAGGALLDRHLHTSPLLMLLGVIASLAVSWILVRSTVRRLQRQIEHRIKESLKRHD